VKTATAVNQPPFDSKNFTWNLPRKKAETVIQPNLSNHQFVRKLSSFSSIEYNKSFWIVKNKKGTAVFG